MKHVFMHFGGHIALRRFFVAAQLFAVLSISARSAPGDVQTPITPTPISLTTIGSAYAQNFDSLATSGTSSTLPAGWAFSESGSGANITYTAGTGSGTTGDTYSFGVAGTNAVTDRAL
jgi:hypothetical protein